MSDVDRAATLAAQELVLSHGDILCIRMGWVGEYRRLDHQGLVSYAESLHRRLIPLLGMTLGEMFDLETLSPFCRAD